MNHPREVRHAIRARRHTGHTAGLAPGHVQGNVCILPREYADEFRAFCERNPKPCPLLAMSRPGDPRLPELGEDLPLFWACGVTPQSVVLDAKPSLCITHAPGHMLVTDLENRSLAES